MKIVFFAYTSAIALAGTAVAQQPPAAATNGNSGVNSVTPDNVLLADWQGAYDGLPPFDQVKPELFPAAIQFGIDEQRREIAAIRDNPAQPTFANTVEPLERSGRRLGRVLSVFSVMTSNMATPTYQALSREWSPKLSAASDAITLDPRLFARIKAVYDKRTSSGLDAKQQRVVTRLYEGYVRRGANLTPEQKQQLATYNSQLAGKFAVFSEKVLADESTFITATEAELAGVPADVKAAAAAAAKSRNLPAGSYAIVNTRSAVDPILTYGDNRALREKLWRAFVNRGDNGDANDTNATIAEILKLRADRAKLLGFASHAEWRMQDTMAKTPAKAQDLMMRVWPAAVARVKEEVRDQQAIAGSSLTIEPWDYRYYQEKVRRQRYNLSQEEVKPYFELDNIIAASYWAAGELYGLDFKEVTGTVPTWHPDIRVYSVTDRKDGRQVGVFYRDDYARTGKRSGAWATTYRSRAGLTKDRIVLGSNNNNFVKPAPGEPVLISLDDAETLFHEFGHAIHYFLSDVYYPSLGGTPRDFVEYPSQVNENWLLTPQVLSRFAKHYKTGEPMPKALLDKIEASSKFNQGFATVEYLSSALVDMALHTEPTGVIDPDKFERETLARLGMPKEIVMRHRLPQFNHLFSSDAYSAGYYSYLWSETMDADTWAAFEQTGNPFDKATADRFRTTLLSTGNETDRAEAYRAFRGRDPDVTELLRKRGFPAN
ncbi:M3 family metallopeptidase [Sphingomonas sp. Y38-1Y]|uniref:M3 family metallopeptidase n=1 Tax=Sphingomonas sp. Y38-1Y TaxID=3078265 RepID=UPI0028E533E2|nr:M3 family metallopeptidase [Sphingomonas sp. Y38-1Y]